MKYSLAVLFLVLFAVVRAEEPSLIMVGGGKAKILKVYATTLDSLEYRSYAINWNGTEVVAVTNTLRIKTKHKVGDELSFVVFRASTPTAGATLVIAEEIPIQLLGTAPNARPAKSDLTDLDIRIDEKNGIWMEGKRYEVSELGAMLLKIDWAKYQVILHSNSEASYATTVKVLDALKGAKVTNVTFTADKEE